MDNVGKQKAVIALVIIATVLYVVLFMMLSSSEAGVISDGSITVSGTAQGISSVPDAADEMLITVETGAVRVSFETTPTDAIGHLLNPGDVMTVYGTHDITSFKVIFNSGVSTAKVWYSISD
jgi:hypothetical protein